MSGFSSGAYKTAFIFDGLPHDIYGVGLINGGFGGLISSHTSWLPGNDYGNHIEWRKKAMESYDLPNKSVFKGKKVYIQAGTSDGIVSSDFVMNSVPFFKNLGCDVKSFKHKYNHIFPSIVKHSFPCEDYSRFSAKNCDNIDTAGMMWRHIMPFQVKPMVQNWSKYGKLMRVNIRPVLLGHAFFDETIDSLADYARLFVPNKCLKGGCHLHVFLHGCKQARKNAFF